MESAGALLRLFPSASGKHKHGISFHSFRPRLPSSKPWTDFTRFLILEAGGNPNHNTPFLQTWVKRSLREYAHLFVRTLSSIPLYLTPPDSHARNVDRVIEGRISAVDFGTDEVIFNLDDVSQRKLEVFHAEKTGCPEGKNQEFVANLQTVKVRMHVVAVMRDDIFDFEEILGGLFGPCSPTKVLRRSKKLKKLYDNLEQLKHPPTLYRQPCGRLSLLQTETATLTPQTAPNPVFVPQKVVTRASNNGKLNGSNRNVSTTSTSSNSTVVHSKVALPIRRGQSSTSLPTRSRKSTIFRHHEGCMGTASLPSSPTKVAVHSYVPDSPNNHKPFTLHQPRQWIRPMLRLDPNYRSRDTNTPRSPGTTASGCTIYPESSASMAGWNTSDYGSSPASTRGSHPSIYDASPVASSPSYIHSRSEMGLIEQPFVVNDLSLTISSPRTEEVWTNYDYQMLSKSSLKRMSTSNYRNSLDQPISDCGERLGMMTLGFPEQLAGEELVEYGYELPGESGDDICAAPEPEQRQKLGIFSDDVGKQTDVGAELVSRAVKDSIDNHPISVRLRQFSGRCTKIKDQWEQISHSETHGQDKQSEEKVIVGLRQNAPSPASLSIRFGDYEGLYGAGVEQCPPSRPSSRGPNKAAALRSPLLGSLYVPRTRQRQLPSLRIETSLPPIHDCSMQTSINHMRRDSQVSMQHTLNGDSSAKENVINICSLEVIGEKLRREKLILANQLIVKTKELSALEAVLGDKSKRESIAYWHGDKQAKEERGLQGMELETCMRKISRGLVKYHGVTDFLGIEEAESTSEAAEGFTVWEKSDIDAQVLSPGFEIYMDTPAREDFKAEMQEKLQSPKPNDTLYDEVGSVRLQDDSLNLGFSQQHTSGSHRTSENIVVHLINPTTTGRMTRSTVKLQGEDWKKYAVGGRSPLGELSPTTSNTSMLVESPASSATLATSATSATASPGEMIQTFRRGYPAFTWEAGYNTINAETRMKYLRKLNKFIRSRERLLNDYLEKEEGQKKAKGGGKDGRSSLMDFAPAMLKLVEDVEFEGSEEYFVQMTKNGQLPAGPRESC